jgi:hypothetical protein
MRAAKPSLFWIAEADLLGDTQGEHPRVTKTTEIRRANERRDPPNCDDLGRLLPAEGLFVPHASSEPASPRPGLAFPRLPEGLPRMLETLAAPRRSEAPRPREREERQELPRPPPVRAEAWE